MDRNIKRMGEDRLTKRVWKTEEIDRRRRGGSKLRWKESITRHLDRARVNGKESKRNSENRDGWRRLVETAEQIK